MDFVSKSGFDTITKKNAMGLSLKSTALPLFKNMFKKSGPHLSLFTNDSNMFDTVGSTTLDSLQKYYTSR